MRLGLAALLLVVVGGFVVTAGGIGIAISGCGGRGMPAHMPVKQVRQEPAAVPNRTN